MKNSKKTFTDYLLGPFVAIKKSFSRFSNWISEQIFGPKIETRAEKMQRYRSVHYEVREHQLDRERERARNQESPPREIKVTKNRKQLSSSQSGELFYTPSHVVTLPVTGWHASLKRTDRFKPKKYRLVREAKKRHWYDLRLKKRLKSVYSLTFRTPNVKN